jgi:hypothetical protein
MSVTGSGCGNDNTDSLPSLSTLCRGKASEKMLASVPLPSLDFEIKKLCQRDGGLLGAAKPDMSWFKGLGLPKKRSIWSVLMMGGLSKMFRESKNGFLTIPVDMCRSNKTYWKTLSSNKM